MNVFRGVALGQYVPADSAVHRLDPRTKILGTLALLVVVFATRSALGFAVLTAALAAALAAARIPAGYALHALRPVAWLVVFSVVLQALFGESGGHPLFHRGPVLITRENVAAGLFYGYRILLLVAATSLMTFTTSPLELTDGLERLLRPLRRIGVSAHDFALMMTIALRFIPTLVEETEKIMKAQTARGAEFTRGSWVRRARALVPLLVPLLLGASRRAEALAVAMEARCYRGGDHRTRMRELRFAPRDYAGAAIVLAVSAAVMLAGGWRP